MSRILICDDEITIRNGLKRIIEKNDEMNLSVVGLAANGLEAAALLKEKQPVVALMDITMPGKDGLAIIAEAAKTSPHTQFVIITGHDEFQYACRALQMRVCDYLLKPIDKESLFNAIKTAMLRYETEAGENLFVFDIGRQAISHLQKNYGDFNLTLSSLADKYHVSESYLSKVIKKETEKGFTEFLTEIRLNKAKELLLNANLLRSQEIAERVGYQNRHYFCRIFKQYTGMSPLEYRKTGQNQPD